MFVYILVLQKVLITLYLILSTSSKKMGKLAYFTFIIFLMFENCDGKCKTEFQNGTVLVTDSCICSWTLYSFSENQSESAEKYCCCHEKRYKAKLHQSEEKQGIGK